MLVGANAVHNSKSTARRNSREALKLKIHHGNGHLASAKQLDGNGKFLLDTSMGISDADTHSFVQLSLDKEESDKRMAAKNSHPIQIWERFVYRLLDKDSKAIWSLVQKLVKKLPDDIIEIYNDAEAATGIKIEPDNRKLYYHEFFKAASCFCSFDILHTAEVEFLIQERLGIQIGQSALQEIIGKKSKESVTDSTTDFFDFELYISVLCDVLKYQAEAAEADVAPTWLRSGVFQIPIDPDNSWKQSWDMFFLFLLLYCSFSVPYSIAFLIQTPAGFDIADAVMDSLFLFDILLSFFTAYDNKGYMVRDLRLIMSNYAKTWFLPDLAGSFPFEPIIVAALQNAPGTSSTNILRILKLIRMLKMIRALRFLNRLNKLKQREGLEQFGHLIGVASAVFSLIFAAHVLGCFFTMMISVGDSDNWLHHYSPALVDADNWVRYVTALYWAIITISTMGYGDILPINHDERMFTIFVALIGAVTFSYCMGTISSLISQYSNVDDRFRVKLQSVLEYLQFRDISPDLRRKVKSYYSLSWRRSPELHDEEVILSELSSSLRSCVLSEIGQSAVSCVPLFQGFDEECIGYIFSKLKLSSFVQGERIYEIGDRGLEMYIVADGRVTLRSKGNELTSERKGSIEARFPTAVPKEMKELSKGDVFGEVALFPDLCCPFRLETAFADTWTMAYTLSADDMEMIGQVYPHAFQRLHELCKFKAMELGARRRAEVAGTGKHNKSLRACKIKLRTSQIKADLIRVKESELLKSDDGDDVINLFLPMESQSGGMNDVQWMSISCMLSDAGEIICIQHDSDGLAADQPTSLGFLRLGKSVFRTLDQEETRIFGKLGKKQVLGCKILLFPQPDIPQAAEPGHSSGEGKDYRFCTWSPDAFEHFRRTVKGWLGATVNPTPVNSPMKVREIVDGQKVSAERNEHDTCNGYDEDCCSAKYCKEEISRLQQRVGKLYDENCKLRTKLEGAERPLTFDNAFQTNSAFDLHGRDESNHGRLSRFSVSDNYAHRMHVDSDTDQSDAGLDNNGMVPRRLLEAANNQILQLRLELDRMRKCMNSAAMMLNRPDPMAFETSKLSIIDLLPQIKGPSFASL